MTSLEALLLLDACCIINLFASRRIAEILHDLPYRSAVAEIVRQEALFVRAGVGMEAVVWEPLLESGLLPVLAFESEAEQETFVELAATLDDGEAATCALALHRGYAVATDDRVARRVLASRAQAIPIYSTTAILRQWCEMRALTEDEIRAVLRDVRERGRFVPPRSDAHRNWWDHFFTTT
jgi:predicted nucleic acid-binding protein